MQIQIERIKCLECELETNNDSMLSLTGFLYTYYFIAMNFATSC